MNHLTSLFLTLFIGIFLITSDLAAQNVLEGNWNVKCIIEKTSQSSISYNDLCRYEKIDQSSTGFSDFEMRINDKTIQIEDDGAFTTVVYSFNPSDNKLKFSYKKAEYNYNVLMVNESESLILKDEGGSLILLEKKS